MNSLVSDRLVSDRLVSDRVCVVTGASSGIGQATAIGLARAGARVRLVGRDPARTDSALRSVLAASPSRDARAYRCDFSELAQVRQLAEELRAEEDEIAFLINNAGLWTQEKKRSKDGFELTFAVNHLAPYLLTRLLLPKMLASRGERRIVHVSSRLHAQVGRAQGALSVAIRALNVMGIKLNLSPPEFDLEDLIDYPTSGEFHGLEAYARSKLAQLLFSTELSRRLRQRGVKTEDGGEIVSLGVHPGSVATQVTRDSRLLSAGIKIASPALKTPEEGAATTLFACLEPRLSAHGNAYLADAELAEAAPIARDPALAYALWKKSAEWTGLEESACKIAVEGSPRVR